MELVNIYIALHETDSHSHMRSINYVSCGVERKNNNIWIWKRNVEKWIKTTYFENVSRWRNHTYCRSLYWESEQTDWCQTDTKWKGLENCIAWTLIPAFLYPFINRCILPCPLNPVEKSMCLWNDQPKRNGWFKHADKALRPNPT
jgi:hypothetical protein